LSKPDHGQSTVEFALGIAMLSVIIVLTINAFALVQRQLDVDLVAREAAFAASRSANPERAAIGVVETLDPGAVDVIVDGIFVTVRVTRHVMGPLAATGFDTVTGSVTVALEPP
jgi:hypothetical protein